MRQLLRVGVHHERGPSRQALVVPQVLLAQLEVGAQHAAVHAQGVLPGMLERLREEVAQGCMVAAAGAQALLHDLLDLRKPPPPHQVREAHLLGFATGGVGRPHVELRVGAKSRRKLSPENIAHKLEGDAAPISESFGHGANVVRVHVLLRQLRPQRARLRRGGPLLLLCRRPRPCRGRQLDAPAPWRGEVHVGHPADQPLLLLHPRRPRPRGRRRRDLPRRRQHSHGGHPGDQAGEVGQARGLRGAQALPQEVPAEMQGLAQVEEGVHAALREAPAAEGHHQVQEGR
mmetsp:Transcript_133252/g.414319  ORF Transcript_133252/g.414319 Transcript_133252/m.414319 type:complete len:288 (-) Transcript_133252:1190-2053(-)